MLLNNLLFYTLHILFLFGRMPLFYWGVCLCLLGRMPLFYWGVCDTPLRYYILNTCN